MARQTNDMKPPDDTLPRCGDSFNCPIPPAFGRSSDADSEISDQTHWNIVFDAHRRVDQKEYERFKDEANNLIVVASLFSAVVTAFLVESYKFLLPQNGPDPVDFGLDHGLIVRLNSLWFCSLVLSLSTVALGILHLQWVQSYQQYNDDRSPHDELAARAIRGVALKAWSVTWVASSLPILNLIALVLFFVGIVDFLLSLNKAVAVPVAILVYSTLAILFLTTILPSCQIFWLYVCDRKFKSTKDLPTPCPYKSPQALLLLRFLSSVVSGVQNGISVRQPERRDISSRRIPLDIFFYDVIDNWYSYDFRWVRLRNAYAQAVHRGASSQSSHSMMGLLHPRLPPFDIVELLKGTAGTSKPSANVLFAAYHCFEAVSKIALFGGIEYRADYSPPKGPERNQILRDYYWNPTIGPPISSLLGTSDTDFLQDENMFIFLQMHTSRNLPNEASHLISAHLCELQARILSYTYTRNPPLYVKPSAAEDQTTYLRPRHYQWLVLMLRQYAEMIESTKAGPPKLKIWSLFATHRIEGDEVSVSHDTIQMAIVQFSHLFQCLVQRIGEPQSSLTWVEGNVIYAHKDVVQFWRVPATMLRYRGTKQQPFNSFSEFEQGFECIRAALDAASKSSLDSAEPSVDRSGQTNADYLFLATCAFIDDLFDPYATLPLHPFEQQQWDLVWSLIRTLDLYEKSPGALDRIQANHLAFWLNTGLPGKPKHDADGDADKRSYIGWANIRKWMKLNDIIAASQGEES